MRSKGLLRAVNLDAIWWGYPIGILCENLIAQERVVGGSRQVVHKHIERVDIVLQIVDIHRLAIVAKHIFVTSLKIKSRHRNLSVLTLELVVA